jgi:hypothetical protein
VKTKLILACAVAGVALGATPAMADSAPYKGSIEFTPNVAVPGQSVNIFAKCNDPDVKTARVVSRILDAPDLSPRGDGEGYQYLVSDAKVKQGVAAGTYPVSFKCDTVTVTGRLRIVEKPGPSAAIGIQDREIKAGQKVLIIASCQDEGFRSSKIDSPVLTAPELRRGAGDDVKGVLSAEGRIAKNARPGKYSLSFVCAGKKVVGKFTIAGKPTVQVPVKPKGAPETGGE